MSCWKMDNDLMPYAALLGWPHLMMTLREEQSYCSVHIECLLTSSLCLVTFLRLMWLDVRKIIRTGWTIIFQKLLLTCKNVANADRDKYTLRGKVCGLGDSTPRLNKIVTPCSTVIEIIYRAWFEPGISTYCWSEVTSVPLNLSSTSKYKRPYRLFG